MFAKIKKLANVFLPGIIIISVCLFFFLPYFRWGKVPVALDIPTGMYYPWLNQSFGFPVKVPVKNPILTDTVSQFWIWRNWAMEGLKNGQVRIWNPYSFSGYEASPWFHSLIFSPLNFFYFLTNQIDAMSLVVIFQLVISLFATYYLGLRLINHKISAFFFSLSWSFSSYFLGWLTWGSISLALAILPLSILFVLRLVENQDSTKEKLGLFLSLVVLLLSGHPQTIAYCLFVIFGFVFYEVFIHKKYWLFLSVLSLFTISLIFISPVLLPSLTIIKNSVRSLDGHLFGVNFGLIKWTDFLSLLFSPNFFGNPATGNYYGSGYNFQEKLTYFGVVPLYFFVVSLINLFQKKLSWTRLQVLGLFFTSLGLFVSIDNPVGHLIYALKIPILSSSPAGRGLIIFIFGAILLSLSSFNLLFSKKQKIGPYILGFILLAFGYLFSFGTIRLTSNFITSSPASLHSSYEKLATNYTITTRNLLPSFSILLASIFVTIAIHFFKKKSSILSVIFLLFIILDGFLFFRKYTPFVPRDLYFPETDTTRFLKQKQSTDGLYRVERQSAEILPPNMWEAYKFYSASGYDPMANKTYQDYLIKQKALGGYSRYVELGEQVSNLSGLGIKYFLVLKRDPSGILSEKGNLPHFIDTKVWREVFTEGPVSVLENNQFKPPYTLTSTGSATLVHYSDTKISFLIDTKTPNTLTFYQNYSKNWQLENPSGDISVSKNKDGFIDIGLPTGTNTIDLIYKNQDYNLGLIFSALSLALLYFVIRKPKG